MVRRHANTDTRFSIDNQPLLPRAARADVNARNRDGETSFDLAEKGSDTYWLLNDARFNAPR